MNPTIDITSKFEICTHLEAVKDVSAPVTSRTKHVEYCAICHLAGLLQGFNILGQLTTSQEHRGSISACERNDECSKRVSK